jgi:hypothetical protein
MAEYVLVACYKKESFKQSIRDRLKIGCVLGEVWDLSANGIGGMQSMLAEITTV